MCSAFCRECGQETDSSVNLPPLQKSDQHVQEDCKEGGEGGSIEHQDSSILFASVPSETKVPSEKEYSSIDNLVNMVRSLKTSEGDMMATSIQEHAVCTISIPKPDEKVDSISHSSTSSTSPLSLPSSGAGCSSQSVSVVCNSPPEAVYPTDKQLCLKFAAENFVFMVCMYICVCAYTAPEYCTCTCCYTYVYAVIPCVVFEL